MMRGRYLARAAIIVTLVAAIVAAMLARDSLEPMALQTLLDELGACAPLAFIAAFAVATVAFVPGSIFGLAGGVLFGPLWGTVWNLAGATLGATIAFLIARYLAGDWVTRKAGGKLQQILRGVDAEGWRFVALTRLVPVVPFNLLNYALGLTRIRLSEYLLATVICMAPGTAAYVWLGHAGRQAAAGNTDALRYALLGLGVLALIVFLPGIVRRLKDTRECWFTVAELKRRLASDASVLVIDVREPEEFRGPFGHIPGARNIPLGQLTARVNEISRLDPAATVLVCRTDKRSAKAADTLRAASVHNVYMLRGGMEKWSRERAQS